MGKKLLFLSKRCYNVNSTKEKEALRSSIYFSCAFNEQTCLRSRHRSAEHEFASKKVMKCGARVCE